VKNLDLLKQQKADFAAKMKEAIQNNDEQVFAEAFVEFANAVQEAVIAEARGLVQSVDNTVLAGRGVRVLTSQEREYYQRIIDAMKSNNPKQALTGFNDVLPETVIDAIFEDITEEHPLLSVINFQNTAALIKYLYSTMDGRHLAWWGKLCSDIEKALNAEFKLLNLEQTKLSAYVPVCKAMLDLGPVWLDRYVRTILGEAIANGLEDGIINGRGIAEQGDIFEPIGMIRDLSQPIDPTNGYAAKVPVPIADLLPETYLPLVADLSIGPNGLNRRITEVLLVVNPQDYLRKIVPATIYRQPDGRYVLDIFPFPTRVVQSAYMDEGTAILGLAKRYLMAMGIGDKGGRIEYSDEYHFLEDERVYLTKFYGTGRPLDNNSFILLDIENVKPIVPAIRVVSWPDATLSDLKVANGNIDISPAFDKNIHYYTAETDNATDLVTATATDPNAVIEATLNGDPTDLGSTQAWEEGQNVIIITVTNGNVREMYVLVVTYEPEV
jgi:hypothetical protein